MELKRVIEIMKNALRDGRISLSAADQKALADGHLQLSVRGQQALNDTLRAAGGKEGI